MRCGLFSAPIPRLTGDDDPSGLGIPRILSGPEQLFRIRLTGTAANPGIPTGTSGAGGSGGGCAYSQAEFKQETPNVMLVVDTNVAP